MKMENAKTKRAIITVAAIVAITVIGIAVLVLREPSTAAVPADETSVEKKVVKKKPIKKVSVPTSAKPTEGSPAKAAKSEPMRPKDAGTAVGADTVEKLKEDVGAQTADKDAKPDNPFPRYLDMFRNNPAALAAEFEKDVSARPL